MSWNLQQPSQSSSGATIVPDKVLYEFDGLLLFTSTIGLLQYLLYKFDETDAGDDLYIATPADVVAIAALVEGRLSVRGAVVADQVWILQLSRSRTIVNSWTCGNSDLSDDMLPEPGVGLLDQNGPLPDSLEESQAFFSLKFQGAGLSSAGMNFGKFKGLIDNAYDAVRKILGPTDLVGAKRSTFDFEIYEPKFSSLVLSIKEPWVNADMISKRRSNTVTVAQVSSEIDSNRVHFLEGMHSMVGGAEKGEISEDRARENFELLEQISHIIPSEGNLIDRLSISANVRGQVLAITVDRKVGDRLQRARELAESSFITTAGKIGIINETSSTFVLTADFGRQITCRVAADVFDKLKRTPEFRTGNRFRVEGRYSRRKQRDILEIDKLPTPI